MPAVEEPTSVASETSAQPSQPIEDLISALDNQQLECMDDRMSESSGEEMVITDTDPKGTSCSQYSGYCRIRLYKSRPLLYSFKLQMSLNTPIGLNTTQYLLVHTTEYYLMGVYFIYIQYTSLMFSNLFLSRRVRQVP